MSTHESRENGSLVDGAGRAITYLRVSVTPRCNLRCAYCFGPGEDDGRDEQLLPVDQVIRLLRVFASLGIERVRFTGGEPLLRRGITELVRGTTAVPGITTVGLTTNGLLLERCLARLVDAGLNRINISLDSMKRETFRTITGADALDRVMAGIAASLASGAFPRVKINTVVMRDINDGELRDMAEWALRQGVDQRFIEFMPTAYSGWREERFVHESEMRQKIGLELEPVQREEPVSGPASTFRYRDCPGRISFISAVSRAFCNACNRLRLTSRGEILGCLFQPESSSLLALLNSGAGTRDIAVHISAVIARPGFRRVPESLQATGHRPDMLKVGG